MLCTGGFWEDVVNVLERSGIDSQRVYVSGGTALAMYLSTQGQRLAWSAQDTDLFIERDARGVAADMSSLLAAAPPAWCVAEVKGRIRAVLPNAPSVDFCFPVAGHGSIEEWVGSFDISVCKVYFCLAMWRAPEYTFVDTAREDIAARRMRVAPVLVEMMRTGIAVVPDRYVNKKMARVYKYMKRGFTAVADDMYSSAMDPDQNADWESSSDDAIVIAATLMRSK